jgi:putative spermidine/putrescine transport system ATP-binding protein
MNANPNHLAAYARGEIELIHVTKRFGETVAVAAIDLKIPGGAYCCLLGPSGCGKTTILRMIAGHEDPTEGDVRIDGERVNGEPPVRRGTAMMFQSYALFPHLNCAENVAFNLKVRGVGKSERLKKAKDMLQRVRMEAFADRLPAQLSGGQQQRIALARALITNPRVLLLDEPLSALDEFLRLQMRSELKLMQVEFGITFIHVTHTQMEAIALADMVVVMDQGRIEQGATAREVFEQPRTPYVARFMGGQNVLSGKVLQRTEDEVVLEGGPRPIRVTAAPSVPAVGANCHISVRRDRITLRRAASKDTDVGLDEVIGRVGTIEYQGSWVKVPLEEASAEEFVAHVPDSAYFAEPVRTGDWVLARWPKDELHYLTTAPDTVTGASPKARAVVGASS